MQAVIVCERRKNKVVAGKVVVEDISVKTCNCTGGSLSARWDTELLVNLSKTGEEKTKSSGFLSMLAVL